MQKHYQSYFTDYRASRQAFLEAVEQSGLASNLYNYPHPLRGLNGERLFTDIAQFGKSSAQNLIIISSAVHGVEGYCGSGSQISIIKSGLMEQLGNDVQILFVHAVNPYGMSHHRRTNEMGYDLNRNFVDSFDDIPRNRLYDELIDSIVPETWTPASNEQTKAAIMAWIENNSFEEYRALLALGQYHHWQGPFYGGNAPSWSRLMFQDFLNQHAIRKEKVIHIDFHTGLGENGTGQFVGIHKAGSDSEKAAMELWGDVYAPAVSDETVAYDISGSIQSFTESRCQGLVVAAGYEFGTIPEREMFPAITADQWLNCYAPADTDQRAEIKAAVLRAFYTDEPWWGNMVAEQGIDATAKSINWLKENS